MMAFKNPKPKSCKSSISSSDPCGSQVSIEIRETLPEQDQENKPNFSVSLARLEEVEVVEKNDDHHHHHPEYSNSTTLDHSVLVQHMAAALQTNIDTGIIGDERDLDCRIKAFGFNQQHLQVLQPNHDQSMMSKGGLKALVLEASKDSTLILLMCCASLSLLIDIKTSCPEKTFIDGTIIFLAIFLAVNFGNIFRFLKTRWVLKRSLHKYKKNFVHVVRQGKTQQIPAFQVVVGDVVLLETGDYVPADGLFVDGTNSCKLDDGLFERGHASDAMHASMFTGAKVVEGSCRMLVTSVGSNTERSKLIGLVTTSKGEHRTEESKLQNGINKTISRLEKIWLSLSLFILIVQVLRCFLLKSIRDESHNPDPKGVKNTVEEIMQEATKIVKNQGGKINGVVSMLCILVFATRDGIPLGIFIFLFAASKRMKSLEEAMVQKLSACATLGLVTTVCLSKMDDLNLNHANMGELWIALNLIKDVSGELNSKVLGKLQVGVCMNSTGSQMEDSLLFWAQKVLQVDKDEMQRNCTVLHNGCVDVDKDVSLLTLRRIEDTQEVLELHWRGDPEYILSLCSHYYDVDGTTQTIDEENRARFNSNIARNHLHCSAFAYNKIEIAEESTSTKDEEESDDVDHNEKTLVKLNDHNHGLILIGLVILKNPYPPVVKQAIEAYRDLGVNVKLMVDDNAKTARIMAFNSGILGPEEDITEVTVIEGSEFRNSSEEARMKIIDKVHVIANATPVDKLLMIQCLKKKGEVVAATGSCIRDFPSLIEADVGILMGYNHAEIGKEDADIITGPNNIGGIAKITRVGRHVCQSIEKFLEFHLILNFSAFTMNFIFEVWKSEAQLSSAQLLWTNLIVEGLGAFALAMTLEKEPSNHQHPPGENRITNIQPPIFYGDGPIISKTMWRNVAIQTSFQVTILMVLGIKGKDIVDADDGRHDVLKTMMFNSYILCQVFVLIGAMKTKKQNRVLQQGPRLLIFSLENGLLLTVLGMILGLQMLLIEIMGVVADWGKLDLKRWLICIGIAWVSTLASYAAKWFSDFASLCASDRIFSLDILMHAFIHAH